MPADHDPALYGERIASVYDDLYSGEGAPPWLDIEGCVERLVALAGEGPVLELGIGTGRVALPLVDRGLDVHGIDASPAMVERLRAKPGGDAVPVTMGDVADVAVEGRYRLVFAAFTTLFALPSQEAQVRCFANVAAHLLPGGAFLVSAFVPDVARYRDGQVVSVSRVETDLVQLEASRHDPVTQQVESQHVVMTEGGVRLYPVHIRYAWPCELDLMARLAGLRLEDRWADWRGGPFTADSTRHVSVYRAAP